ALRRAQEELRRQREKEEEAREAQRRQMARMKEDNERFLEAKRKAQEKEREYDLKLAMSDRIQKKMNMMGEVMKRVNDKSAEDERRAEEERQ
ncbi:unnamed protein product, partial [Symbiodinium sp. KB8]